MKKYIKYMSISIATILLLSGCNAGTGETDPTADSKSEKENTSMVGTYEVNVDDLMDTTEWIGKTQDEIGLNMDEKEISCDVKGTFLGSKASGNVGFADKNENGQRIAGRVTLSIRKSSLYDFYNKLMDIYGGPIKEGMEPYAESNGGAVEWYTFDAGNVLIVISQGSKSDNVLVEIKENPNPSSTEKLVLRRTAESEIATLPLEMMIKAVSYDNGFLTVAITNQTGSDMTYTDDFILAKSSDGGQTYAHLNKMGNKNTIDCEPNTYEIADLETQELKCDLRQFGKIEAGMYMIIFDDANAEFQLIPESEDTGAVAGTPWFCPECGTKNRDTDVCTACGAHKE